MFFRAVIVVLIAGPQLFGAGCAEQDSRSRIVAADDFGHAVRAGTADDPARIVSLNPTTTELLFALTAGRRLVGRTTWDLVPDSARLVANVGPGLRPNVEAVLARQPDLVILYASDDNRAAASQLRDAGVDVIALKIDSITHFARAARLVGLATGLTAEAESVIGRVEGELARVRAETASLPRPRVVWLVWHDPLIVIGGGSYLDELLEIAGARNAYEDLAQPSPQVALEDLLRRDPDVILAAPADTARIRRDPAWQALRAVRSGRVLAVDTLLVGRPSVRLGEAAAALAGRLHPELRR